MNSDVFQKLRELELPPADYAVFGSGPLIVRGLIPFSNDLDIICRGCAWQQVRQAGDIVYLRDYETHVVSVAEGAMTFGTHWGIGEFDIDALIDNAEIIDGLPFVRLVHVAHYKRIRGLPKDLHHLEVISSAGFLP